MKKIIAILIISAMLLPAFSVFAAEDYTNHWAYKYINYLKNEGIVSGDSNGNMRPDSNISRAEFAQVTNKAFGYSEKSSDNFKDVENKDWYFDAMSIAKKAGYFKGDENGNVNPDNAITRAEAATAVARILGLDVSDEETGFTDDSKIPSWAKGAVTALKNKGIINGYTDGSYKPYDNMKRAEYFTVVAKQISSEQGDAVDNNAVSVGMQSDKYNNSSSGGSSGGGGGGGFAPSTPVAPRNLFYNEGSYTLSWDAQNGSTFTGSITRATEGKTAGTRSFSVTNPSYNILSDVQALMNVDGRIAKETFIIKVSAMNAYGVSSESSVTIVFSNSVVEVPSYEVIQTVSADGEEGIKLSWTPSVNASSYNVSIDLGNGYENLIVSDNVGKKEAVLSAEQIIKLEKTRNVKTTVTSASPSEYLDATDVVCEVEFPLYNEIETTRVKKISNARHFRNIALNNKDSYVLTNDIFLGEHEPFAFEGNLDGAGYTIDLTVNKPGVSNVGMFSEISGGFQIKNFIITGSITGGYATGALAGKVYNTTEAAISGIINKADITGVKTGTESVYYVAGIVGYAYQTTVNEATFSIKNCVNYGNINGIKFVGGIVGISGGITQYCANVGNVTASASDGFAGGVIAQSYGGVTFCYNAGKVDGGNHTGGVIGQYTSNTVPTALYNSGEIKSGSNAAPIICYGNYDITLKDCYNANTSSATTAFVAGQQAGKTLTYNNCYTIPVDDPTPEGMTELTVEEFKDLSNFDLDTNLWKTDSATKYDYPQFVQFPHIVPPVKLSVPDFNDNPYNDSEKVNFYFGGDERAEKLNVVISDNNGVISEEEIDCVNGETTYSVSVSEFTEGTEYTITAYYPGDERFYFDSDSFTGTYTHQRYTLRAPSFNGVLWSDSGVENYTVSWKAPEGESPSKYDQYKIIVKDGDEIITETSVSSSSTSYDIEYSDSYNNDILTVEIITSKSTDDTMDSLTPLVASVDMRFAGVQIKDNVNYNVIATERHFENILNNLSGKYLLNNNLDIASWTSPKDFSGVFDGNNNELNINSTRGLFETTTKTAVVRNLIIKGAVSYEGEGGSSNRGTGAVVGFNKGRIENCINYATVSHVISSAQGVGGIAGYNDSTGVIVRCYNYASVELSSAYGGGIAGLNFGSVYECGNYGTIGKANTGGGNRGGVVGLQQAGSSYPMTKCYNFGEVYGSASIGGVAGSSAASDNTFINCFNAGKVVNVAAQATPKKQVGGINGYCASGHDIIKYCYNVGSVGYGSAANGITDDMSLSNGIWGHLNSGRVAPEVTKCYYLGVDSTDAKDNTEPLNETEMQSSTNFVDWDFENVWEFGSGEYLYPVLKGITK